jgi:hypothetical protein
MGQLKKILSFGETLSPKNSLNSRADKKREKR